MSRRKKSTRKASKHARRKPTPIGDALVPRIGARSFSHSPSKQVETGRSSHRWLRSPAADGVDEGLGLVPELAPRIRTLTERLDAKLAELKKNNEAMRWLSHLRSVGVSDERFLVWSFKNIWMALQPPAKDKLENVPGLTLETIDNLVVDAEMVAENLKTLHEHGVYVSGPWNTREENKLVRDLFAVAEHLSARVDQVRRRKRPGTKGMEPGGMEKLRLIGYVRHITGKPHYNDLANLINIFNRMEDQLYGCTTAGDKVTVNSLTLLWAAYESLPELADIPTKLPLTRLSAIN